MVFFSEIWSLTGYYDEIIERQRQLISRITETPTETQPQKQKLEDGSEIIVLPHIYNKWVIS